MPCAWPVTEDMKNPPHYPLTETPRYQGDGVAVVLAETRAQAKDAAELVEVDYEPRDAIVDVAKALDGRRAARPSRPRHERVLRLAARHRRDRTGDRRRGRRRHAPLLPTTPDPERDRATRRGRRAGPDRRRDALLRDAGPAHPARARRSDARHAARRSSASSRPTSAAASARSSTSTPRSCSRLRSRVRSAGR